ncbi:MAG: hypothetical protein HYU36_01050 [Planctomycetes bacterium]|nr:hypothetical protein [Planctomycetota bacterium]
MTSTDSARLVEEGFDFCVSTGAYIPYFSVPVARGVSLPEGAVKDTASFHATRPDGKSHPMQATPLCHWPDGSVKWALLELPASVPAAPPANLVQKYHVRQDGGKSRARGDVRCKTEDGHVVLSNGRITLRFDPRRFAPLGEVLLDGKPVIRRADSGDIVVEDARGKRYHASLAKDCQLEIEHAGSVRTTVRWSGKHTAPDGSTFLDFRLRISLFHDCPDVLVEHQFANREDAQPGVRIRGLKLFQELNVGRKPAVALRQASHGVDTEPRPLGGIRSNMAIHVGTPLCQARRCQGPLVADPVPFQEDLSVMDFHIRDFPGVLYGSGPWLDVSGRAEGRVQGVTVFFRNMAENHPKIVENEGSQVTFHVVPSMPDDLHYMQGWSKRHEIFFCFHQGRKDTDPEERDRAWYRWENPPSVTVPFEWYQRSGVEEMDKILPPRYRKYPILEAKLSWVAAIGGSTGMINWGDIYSAEGRWGEGGVGWNHEEDTPYGQFLLALRNEDAARFTTACIACRHLVDIDSISYSQDPLRCGAIAPHAKDHVRGATYPSHMWITGITLYYYLTGDPDAREAAVAQAEVNLRFIEKRWHATTLTGREHGWPILNLATVYELTRDERYLDGAHKLIRDVERRMDEYGGVTYAHHPYQFGVFANYSIYEGLFKTWQQTGDEKLKGLFLRVVDWLITTVFEPRGFSYCRNGQWFANLFPLAMAYHMTGDEKYAQAGKVGTILMMTYHPIDTWCLRELLHFLPLADARGWIQECAPQNAETDPGGEKAERS